MKEKLTKYLLIYYFVMINIYKLPYINSKIIYIALVGPLAVVLGYSLKFFANSNQNKRTILIFFHFILVSIISLTRFDISTILNVAQMFIIIYFLLNKPVEIEVGFFNKLFLTGIILAFVGSLIGTNIYGVTFTSVGLIHSRLWRVSLFFADNLPVSAAFATLIFILNFFYKSKWRTIILLSSFYFIVLSGSKTSIVILGFAVLSIILSKKTITVFSKYALILLPIMSIIFILNIGEWLNSLSYYLTENHTKLASWLNISYLTNDVFSGRNQIWEYHINIFKENWFFGVGNFILSDFAQDVTIGSESKFSFILARDGIFSFLFFGQFLYMVYESVRKKSILSYIVISALIMIMFFYGSFANGYNFGFIIYIAIYASELKKRTKHKKEVEYKGCEVNR